jgi:hypothetical protein
MNKKTKKGERINESEEKKDKANRKSRNQIGKIRKQGPKGSSHELKTEQTKRHQKNGVQTTTRNPLQQAREQMKMKEKYK